MTVSIADVSLERETTIFPEDGLGGKGSLWVESCRIDFNQVVANSENHFFSGRLNPNSHVNKKEAKLMLTLK